MIAHFFVAPEQIQGDVALLGADDSRHLTTVLRARPGMTLTVADGSGTVWTGRFQGSKDTRALVSLESSETVAPDVPAITVVHALPKQRKLDEIIQRLTELGVARIIPVHSERSQVELAGSRATKAVARWRAVAMAAAKQSRRPRLPVIADLGTWASAFGHDEPGIVCWEETSTGLRTVLEGITAPSRLTVAIGPEGGLTPDEIRSCGLPAVSLGTTVLRTETAALVAMAAVRYHYGLMERP